MSATRLSHERPFTGRVFHVEVDRVRLPHGPTATLEVVRHPPSVVIAAMPSAHEVLLVRQYRYAIDAWVWELPAGSVDPGEALDAAAARECHEETGLRPARVERLSSLYPTPGYCDECMHFYRATGLHEPETPAAQDEDEHLEPKVFSLAAVVDMIARGEIVDMKTVVGVALLARSS
jgi:ADP-ribose pyrophosphatase